MKTVGRLLFCLSHGCAKLPVLAAVVLAAVARVTPFVVTGAASVTQAAAFEVLPGDVEIIDAILAKRAPELGLTLRRQLAAAIAGEAQRAGYDPLLVLAIIDVESDFEEDAVSAKGARGLMQIRPSTLFFLAQRREGLRLTREEVETDPALRVRLGVRYLRWLHDRFGDLDLALMAYNAGPTRLREALRSGDAEPFRRYARLVRRDFLRFRRGEGLMGDWALAQRGGGRNGVSGH